MAPVEKPFLATFYLGNIRIGFKKYPPGENIKRAAMREGG